MQLAFTASAGAPSGPARQPEGRKRGMKKQLLASAIAVAFTAVSGAAWAQAGGNFVPVYPKTGKH